MYVLWVFNNDRPVRDLLRFVTSETFLENRLILENITQKRTSVSSCNHTQSQAVVTLIPDSNRHQRPRFKADYTRPTLRNPYYCSRSGVGNTQSPERRPQSFLRLCYIRIVLAPFSLHLALLPYIDLWPAYGRDEPSL